MQAKVKYRSNIGSHYVRLQDGVSMESSTCCIATATTAAANIARRLFCCMRTSIEQRERVKIMNHLFSSANREKKRLSPVFSTPRLTRAFPPQQLSLIADLLGQKVPPKKTNWDCIGTRISNSATLRQISNVFSQRISGCEKMSAFLYDENYVER